jgi:hypothetical protein
VTAEEFEAPIAEAEELFTVVTFPMGGALLEYAKSRQRWHMM